MSPLPRGFEPLTPGSREQLCDLLERVQILSDFPRREVEILAPYFGAYKIQPQTAIFNEGRKDNFLCFLVEGTADVIKQQSDQEQRKIATIRAGKTMGEMAFLDHQPHSATVVSTDEAIVLLLSESGFQRLSKEHPRVALNLLWRVSRLLSQRLRQTSGQLVDYL